MRDIVLVQPHEGAYNKIMKPWVPLSLLATSVKLEAEGYPITVIDQRVDPGWKHTLIRALERDPVCVGVTSMTGSQILGALEASKLVKEHSRVPVVWGGVHATLFPEQTLEHELVDVVIKGEGEETFYQLVKRLEHGGPYDELAGVACKTTDGILVNPDRSFLDPDTLPHPPYHLVNLEPYIHQYFSEKRVIEVESSRGCPHHCGFCYNLPYNKRTWRPLSPDRVVDRLALLMDRYGLTAFHFLDDAFFIDRGRADGIMRRLIDLKLELRLGFQGIRVDTLARISDAELDRLYQAGGRFLQFGVESGSPRILEMINKRIKVDEVITLNRRLAKYPDLIPYYNFMCGFPTETKEDLFQTTTLAWTLLKENRKALISPFHHFKPYPGTPLADLILKDRYDYPKTLEEWGCFDWTEAQTQTQDPGAARLFKRVELASILADGKMEAQSDSPAFTALAKMYRPVARFRLSNNFYSMMPEAMLFR